MLQAMKETDGILLPPPLPCGTMLDKYELRAVVGQGGGGISYLAVDRQLEREVVLKEHLPAGLCRRLPGSAEVEPLRESDYLQSLNSFCRGARILSGLNHKGIVKVHEVFSAGGTAFMVMEYAEGVTLREWMAGKPPVGEIRRLLESCLDTLVYMHSCGVIHRDIKPANIVVVDDNQPILLDFDTCMVGEPTHAPTLVGTPGYAAPEQLHHGEIPGPTADIYALGGTLKRVADECAIQLPLALARSIKKACSEKPQDRYQNAQAWKRALHHRGPEYWAVAGVLSVAIVVCLLFWQEGRMDSEPQAFPESLTQSLPPKRSFHHPIDLVELGNDLRMKKGFHKEPELLQEREFQDAVLAAQQETDAACAALYEAEVKTGRMSEFAYNRKRYDLEQELNNKLIKLWKSYISSAFDGKDPQPDITHNLIQQLEIRKLAFVASMATDYPMHPHDLLKYDVLGRIVRPQKAILPSREESLVLALLGVEQEYQTAVKNSPSSVLHLKVQRNRQVADLITEYLKQHFDENYPYHWHTKSLLRRVLAHQLPADVAAPILADYPYVFSDWQKVQHRVLGGNGELRIMTAS